jgi:hypothetical protein
MKARDLTAINDWCQFNPIHFNVPFRADPFSIFPFASTEKPFFKFNLLNNWPGSICTSQVFIDYQKKGNLFIPNKIPRSRLRILFWNRCPMPSISAFHPCGPRVKKKKNIIIITSLLSPFVVPKRKISILSIQLTFYMFPTFHF